MNRPDRVDRRPRPCRGLHWSHGPSPTATTLRIWAALFPLLHRRSPASSFRTLPTISRYACSLLRISDLLTKFQEHLIIGEIRRIVETQHEPCLFRPKFRDD